MWQIRHMHSTREPRVSVVVTNYNHAAYVQAAVGSALGQTTPPLEVLVIDDGSTDDSRERLAQFTTDSRVRLRFQANQGIVASRNRGLREAQGDWVVFLDSDDELLPTFIERTYGAWSQRADARVAVVYTNARVVGAAEGVLRARSFNHRALALGNYIYNCCLLRRDAALATGGYDPAFQRSHEDWDLFLRIVEAGSRGLHVPESLFLYRRHEAASRNINSAQEYAAVVALMIERHPATYSSWLNRRLVQRRIPGLALLLWVRRQFRPRLPQP